MDSHRPQISVEVEGISIWDPRLGKRGDPSAYIRGGDNPALVLLDMVERDPELRRQIFMRDYWKLRWPWWKRAWYRVRLAFGWTPEPDVDSFVEMAEYCDELVPDVRVNGAYW